MWTMEEKFMAMGSFWSVGIDLVLGFVYVLETYNMEMKLWFSYFRGSCVWLG